MIIVMEPAASEEQIQNVVGALVRHGFDAHRSSGASRTVIGAVGNLATPADPRGFELLPGVHQVVTIAEPYKLAGRAFRPEGSVVRAGSVALGGPEVVVAAGPCAVRPTRSRGWRRRG
jgi:3-deoxy-7-phosphoheptulonate synthase